MATILDIDSFEPRYRNALIFSLFESLRPGCKILLLIHENPKGIQRLFEEAQIHNVFWNCRSIQSEHWEIEMLKEE